MSWKHWTAVVVAIGVGIVWQIPRHEDAMEGHRHSGHASAPAAASYVPAGPYRTITLDLTGMT